MKLSLGAPRLHGISSHLCLRCRVQAQQRHFTTTTMPVVTTRPSNCVRATRTTTALPVIPSLLAAPARNLSSAAASAAATPDASSSPSKRTATPRTHYDLFPESLPQGPPPRGPFPIDTRALRREFLRLQSSQHPDFHQHRSELRIRAEAASALINDAYRTLSNPLLRAQYILSLRGVDVAEDETLKIEEPDLLMLVLEAREEIEEAEDEADLEEPRKVNERRIAEGEKALDEAFAKDDLETAKREAVRMRYWVNIQESLNNWEKGKPVVLEH